MKYTVDLSKKASKYLKTLSKRDYNLVIATLLSLEIDPYQSGIKKLKSYDNTYRIRAGNYRILYTIDGGRLIVNVIDIGDRKDVYN